MLPPPPTYCEAVTVKVAVTVGELPAALLQYIV
jgi:hypothetical protein